MYGAPVAPYGIAGHDHPYYRGPMAAPPIKYNLGTQWRLLAPYAPEVAIYRVANLGDRGYRAGRIQSMGRPWR